MGFMKLLTPTHYYPTYFSCMERASFGQFRRKCNFIGFWFFAKSRSGYIYMLILAILIILFFTNFPKVIGNIGGIKSNVFYLFRSLPYFLIGLILGMQYKSFTAPEYLRRHWFILALCLIPLLYPQFSPVTSDAKTKMWLSYEVLLVMSTVFFASYF